MTRYIVGWLLGAITIGSFTASHYETAISKGNPKVIKNVIYKCKALEGN